ncbi:hypothetical protein LINPERHAP2_LOCUS16993 [Linum perenne]
MGSWTPWLGYSQHGRIRKSFSSGSDTWGLIDGRVWSLSFGLHD